MKINNSSLESISQFKHINKFSLFNKNDELGCVNCFIFPINSKGFDYSLIEECLLPSIPEFTLSAHTRILYESNPMKLSQVAREQFKEALKNKGELGELLLFCFLEGYLKAPKILTKYDLKTSKNMPVHGSDGIHLKKYNDNSYYLIFGESKTYSKLKDAIKDAFKSIVEFMREVNHSGDKKSGIHFERGLLSRHIEKDVFEEDDKDVLEALVYPSKKTIDISINDAFGIFIGYEIQITDEQKILTDKAFKESIEKSVIKQVTGIKQYIIDEIKKSGLLGSPFYIFVLPFTEIDENRKRILEDVLR